MRSVLKAYELFGWQTVFCLPALYSVGVATCLMVNVAPAQLVAFPGAVGQGAAASGGRGGEVYHVTNLLDYDSDEPTIVGSLRHAITTAIGVPRTIVFDVGGAIQLSRRLNIDKTNLTIAGQTSPSGITLWGYPTSISGANNVVIRHLRFRTGDFNAQTANPDGSPTDPVGGNGNMDLLGDSADAISISGDSEQIILDHISAAWSMDETVSVTRSRNVTVQNSIVGQSLNDSFHHKGAHGYGSLVRGEVTTVDQAAGMGGYTFFGNLWAHHNGRNPAIGGQQNLDPGQVEVDRRQADVNLVNNVIYNWGNSPTHRVGLGTIRVNAIGNYYVSGPDSPAGAQVFKENSSDTSHVYQAMNYRDSDKDASHDGILIEDSLQSQSFTGFSAGDTLTNSATDTPFNFFSHVQSSVIAAPDAYAQVIDSAGASLWRDAIDNRLISEVTNRTGGVIDSQDELRVGGVLEGIEDLPATMRPSSFDTDRDGIPNMFELYYGLNPKDDADRNHSNLSTHGFTNLEFYLDALTSGTADVYPIQAFVNRDTNRLVLQNVGSGSVVMTEYRVSSDAAGLEPDEWLSIADNYDVDGDQSVDPFSIWQETSATSTLLSEEDPNGIGAVFAPGQTIDLGIVSSGGPAEDTLVEVILDGGVLRLPAIYQNLGPDPESADFNGDLAVDGIDFLILQQGFGSGTTFEQGDADEDGNVDQDDLRIWEQLYGSTISLPSATAAAVPEPVPLAIALAAFCWLAASRISH